MRYVVKVAMGDMLNRELSFNGWQPGQMLVTHDRSMVLEVDASSEEGAAEVAWAIANRVGKDVNGRTWPSWIRSMSVSDVALVWDADGAGTAWAVRPFGWEKFPIDDALVVLVESRSALTEIGAAA